MSRFSYTSLYFWAILTGLILLQACANVGMPSGGPKDTTPPAILESSPANFSTNFKATEAEIQFNEYIQLKNLNKQLIVSPPMEKKPEIKAKGKKILISFQDSLLPNTTYSINFGNAVADFNEGNVLEDFQYVFSTGDVLDSLRISGEVTDAFTSLPVEGAVVMLYKKSGDSLLVNDFPYYVGRSNAKGRFSVKNIADTSYTLLALVDINNNYKYDSPDEQLAFCDSMIKPFALFSQHIDTIQVDTLTGKAVEKTTLALPGDSVKKEPEVAASGLRDSLVIRNHTRFLPDSLSIQVFKQEDELQALSTKNRPASNHFQFIFKIPHPQEFAFQLQDKILDSLNAITIISTNRDSVDIWLLDSMEYRKDTLISLVSWQKKDSLGLFITQTDTVRLAYHPKKETVIQSLGLSTNFKKQGTAEMNEAFYFTTTEPIQGMDESKFHLFQKMDTIFRELVFSFIRNPGNPCRMDIKTSFESGKTYRLRLDSGAFTSIYGLSSDSLLYQFDIRKPDAYGSLILRLPEEQRQIILEITTEKGVVVASQQGVFPGTVTFHTLLPDKYTIRYIIDENKDGKYTPGNYLKKQKPEKVYYPQKGIQVRANWELELEIQL